MMSRFLIKVIRFYQKHISPHLPPMCRYYPTCSAYTLQAIERFGALKGSFMGMCRLLRCNQLWPGGYDPVPEKKEHKHRR